MLRFTEYFSEDKEINSSISRALNKRLVAMMEDILRWHDMQDIDEIREDNGSYLNLDRYMPCHLMNREPAQIFCELYDLLQDEEEHVPDPWMEYLLSRIIDERIAMCEVFGLGMRFRLFDREKIEEQILRNRPQMNRRSMKTYLDKLEDIRKLPSLCFWDMDYELLDTPYARIFAGGERYGA